MKSLKEISQRIDLRRKRLEEGLDKIVKQLKKTGALRIVLFGSFVSGTISPASDLDIFVIMPQMKSGKEWLKEIYQNLERYVASDIIVFNLKEYEAFRNKSSLLRAIERKGKVIYEKRI